MKDGRPDEDVEKALETGIRQFNNEDFFECHDTWEEAWMGLRGSERPFFQGLIQIAVGYYHLTCENHPGAEHLLTRGIAKLKKFLPSHRGIDLDHLLESASKALAQTISLRAGEQEAHQPESFPKIRRTKRELRAGALEVGKDLGRG